MTTGASAGTLAARLALDAAVAYYEDMDELIEPDATMVYEVVFLAVRAALDAAAQVARTTERTAWDAGEVLAASEVAERIALAIEALKGDA